MAVKIRMTRMGRKKSPMYRVVVADGRCRRDGRFIENLGTYSPTVNDVAADLNLERFDHWVKTGALPSQSVSDLVSRIRSK